jgi:HAD superfamily hydrolase (TIGR01484 family)
MGKYKALIFDIDGTVMPIGRESRPTKKVSEAFRKYTSRFIISPATGRHSIHVQDIIKQFDLRHPLILMGGSQIIDHKHGNKVLWERKIDKKLAGKIYSLTAKLTERFVLEATDIKNSEEISQDANIIFLAAVHPENVESALKHIAKFPQLKALPLKGWKKGTYDIHILNKEANKGIAMEAYFGLMGLKQEEVIVVGDSINDYDLFEHAGYKIAMGNSDEKLKSLADLVVGDVSEDGVIAALEKLDH